MSSIPFLAAEEALAGKNMSYNLIHEINSYMRIRNDSRRLIFLIQGSIK
jgi:hypothetical protein